MASSLYVFVLKCCRQFPFSKHVGRGIDCPECKIRTCSWNIPQGGSEHKENHFFPLGYLKKKLENSKNVKQNKIPERRIQNNTWYLAYVPCKHNSIYHCNTDISLCTKYLLSKLSVARRSRLYGTHLYFFCGYLRTKKPHILYSGLHNTMVEPSARYCELLQGFRVQSTQEDSIFYTYRP